MDMTSQVADRPTDTPLVSVVIPTYNSAGFVDAAIDSVLNQTFRDYELIVINDGSPDTELLEAVLAGYRSVVHYIKQENSGPGGARNAGIRSARGEYIAFLDSDDTWEPRYLEEQLNMLFRDPSLDLVYSDAIICSDSNETGPRFMDLSPSHGAATFEALLRWQCHVITSCVVARRQALLDAGLFDPRFFHSEDYDLWLRVAHQGKRLAYQRRVLAKHRMRGGSLAMDRQRMHEGQLEVLKKVRQTLDLAPTERALVERQIEESEAFLDLEDGKALIGGGEYQRAAQALARANRFYGLTKISWTVFGLRIAPRLFGRLYGLIGSFRAGSANIHSP